MKQLSTKELIYHLQDAVSWLLPVSLIVITFLILFFGISEQVGNLKVYSSRIALTVSDLKNDVDQLKGSDVPTNIDTKDEKPTVSAESASVSGIRMGVQKLLLTDENYWGYTFSSVAGVSVSKDAVIDFSGGKAFVQSYMNNPTGVNAPFDLYRYSDQNNVITAKSTNVAYVLVFVDGKVVLYNDFANNDKSKLVELLKSIAGSKDVDSEIKTAASNEATKY